MQILYCFIRTHLFWISLCILYYDLPKFYFHIYFYLVVFFFLKGPTERSLTSQVNTWGHRSLLHQGAVVISFPLRDGLSNISQIVNPPFRIVGAITQIRFLTASFLRFLGLNFHRQLHQFRCPLKGMSVKIEL